MLDGLFMPNIMPILFRSYGDNPGRKDVSFQIPPTPHFWEIDGQQ